MKYINNNNYLSFNTKKNAIKKGVEASNISANEECT